MIYNHNLAHKDCRGQSPALPATVKDFLYKQDPDFKVLRVIKDKYPRLVLHVQICGNDCLIKAVKRNTPWRRPGRYFRFQKEIFINTRLKKLVFTYFQSPRLIHTDGKSFIVAEFISNNPSLPRDYVFLKQAIKAVAELNACDFPFTDKDGIGWFWEKFNRLKFSRSTKTVRNLLEGFFVRRTVGLKVFISSMIFCRRATQKVKPLNRPLLLHRDIFKSNIIYPDKDIVYFVDFEKMGLEKRWVFSDALKIAQADPLFFGPDAEHYAGFPVFYTGILKDFWNELLIERPELGLRKNDFNYQLKFCLLGWTLKKLVKEEHSAQQKKDLNRFLEHLVSGDDVYFKKWFSNCPE